MARKTPLDHEIENLVSDYYRTAEYAVNGAAIHPDICTEFSILWEREIDLRGRVVP